MIPLAHTLDESGLPRHQPVPGADITHYHHPHFVRSEPGPGDGWEQFFSWAFTGLEEHPKVPSEVCRDGSVSGEKFQALRDQYRVAEILWSKARLRLQAVPLLRRAAPLWQVWTAARDDLRSVFAQVWHTEDGRWRAQLLRLTDAEQDTRTAAAAWDAVAAQLAQFTHEQIVVAGEAEELPLTTIACEIGLDASDWHIAWHRDYTDRSPWYGDGQLLADALNHEIDNQRERLREVDDLTPPRTEIGEAS
ncbi:hypothetical protein [Streptomyces wuyuanensis]|uniref:hypothetical protein n=1 Tax=Streptomyces wuyuanensis TaxID=1196353 RepID=UPI0034170D54